MRAWATSEPVALPGVGQAIRVWDSASGQLATPVTLGEPATLYVCGITPYDSTHMGHAATYIAFDLLQRAWRDGGSEVHYVQNVTDIDDPLLERANQVGQDWRDIAERETRRFRDDATSLRLLPPRSWISVTEHMQGIVDYIERMRQADVTYLVDEDLYFDVSSTRGFGRVSGLADTDMLTISGQRGGDPERFGKRNPLDALLWRAARAGEPSWDAPWGKGRPGWHVECLAIARDLLGDNISVQGGGSDLLFPHHEYCAAEAASIGDHFATAYVHAGMVGYLGEKMSKSRGNLVFVSDLRSSGVDPMAIRCAILNHHYRSDWEWTDAELHSAEARLGLWRRALATPEGADGMALLGELRSAMASDLDAPTALAAVDRWADATLAGDTTDPAAAGLVARGLDSLLGIAL